MSSRKVKSEPNPFLSKKLFHNKSAPELKYSKQSNVKENIIFKKMLYDPQKTSRKLFKNFVKSIASLPEKSKFDYNKSVITNLAKHFKSIINTDINFNNYNITQRIQEKINNYDKIIQEHGETTLNMIIDEGNLGDLEDVGIDPFKEYFSLNFDTSNDEVTTSITFLVERIKKKYKVTISSFFNDIDLVNFPHYERYLITSDLMLSLEKLQYDDLFNKIKNIMMEEDIIYTELDNNEIIQYIIYFYVPLHIAFLDALTEFLKDNNIHLVNPFNYNKFFSENRELFERFTPTDIVFNDLSQIVFEYEQEDLRKLYSILHLGRLLQIKKDKETKLKTFKNIADLSLNAKFAPNGTYYNELMKCLYGNKDTQHLQFDINKCSAGLKSYIQ